MGRTRTSEDVVGHFNRTAVVFTSRYESDPAFHERRLVWRRAIERALVGLPTDALCLDLGCGDGSLTRFLAAQCRPVVGLDQSEGMLELARRHAGAEDLGRWTVYRRATMPLEDSLESQYERKVGVIVCSSVLEYVPDPVAALKQCRRLLMPGGTLLVSLPNRESLYRVIQRVFSRMWARSDSYLRHQRHQYRASDGRALLVNWGYRVSDVVFFALPFQSYTGWMLPRYRGRWLATMILFAAQKACKPASDNSPVEASR